MASMNFTSTGASGSSISGKEVRFTICRATQLNKSSRVCRTTTPRTNFAGKRFYCSKHMHNSCAKFPSHVYRSFRCQAAVAEVEDAEIPAEKLEYQAEVSRLLDLIVHSLYSHKEVFLRELVSNASDALDKLRFLSVTDDSLMKDAPELEIRIKPDPDNSTITIVDTGIGMTKQDLIESLGTIAQSGTAKFINALKDNKDALSDNNLIGQFGVGFYSAFLVAEKVIVSTKSPKSDRQFVWEGEADSSSYIIREETDPEKLLPRGTSITLYLKPDDAFEYSDPIRIKELVKSYSQFISFPIHVWMEKTRTVPDTTTDTDSASSESQEEKEPKTKTEKYYEWELVNETKPIWMRNPKEVEKSEYDAFYKSTFNEYLDPSAYTHFTTEGEVEFRSLLYIPGMAPFNAEELYSANAKNIRLYVKRVFISSDFDGELLPRYLGFVKGVVDSNDLPLNVSREILQESRIVRIMKKRLVRKIFDMCQEIADREDKEAYKNFWTNFGRSIKLGCIEDSANHKRLTPLLRFFTSKHEDSLVSLKTYVENMKPDQNAIYYFAADSIKSAKSAPFLEALLKKDYEVLFLIEPIDEVAITNLQEYEGKKFVDISKEDLDLGGDDEEEEREKEKEYQLLCDWMKQILGDKVAKVQVSKRISTSPCVLVSGKFGWSANMERIMKAQTLGDDSTLDFMRGRRVLEINPDHPIIKDLNLACKDSPRSTKYQNIVNILHETAMISSGFFPENSAEYGGKVFEVLGLAMASQGDHQSANEEEEEKSADVEVVPEVEVLEPSEVQQDSDPWN
ncbi:hypothetical protein KP509_31G021500 [Ceratopteris richardii]|uniref:Histidine kinase/HSP90-like ATPase domain-containing protein n=1 Tax=Ceratopteris richardii TaxID=49495 RepID=A0A8T2QWT4_CERRI|nr:hypothetical protein KP509_31G021500 [Ceratopteris richardii]